MEIKNYNKILTERIQLEQGWANFFARRTDLELILMEDHTSIYNRGGKPEAHK